MNAQKAKEDTVEEVVVPEPIVIKTGQEGFVFKNLSRTFTQKFGLPLDNRIASLNVDIVWDGDMIETMIDSACKYQLRNWYNNNRPSGDKKVQTSSECIKRSELIKGWEQLPKPYKVMAIAERKRGKGDNEDVLIKTLKEGKTEDLRSAARIKLNALQMKHQAEVMKIMKALK